MIMDQLQTNADDYLVYHYDLNSRKTQYEVVKTTLMKRYEINKDYGERLLLLLDAALMRKLGCLDDYLNAIDRDEHYYLSPIHPNVGKAMRPCLIDLDLAVPSHLAIFEKSIEQALLECHPEVFGQQGGRFICAWLTSPFTAQDVSEVLGDMMLQRGPKLNWSIWRLHDPAVVPALLDILNTHALSRLFSTVSLWSIIDGDGQLRQMSFPQDPYISISSVLPANDETRQKIKLIQIMNKTLKQYRLANLKQPRLKEQIARSRMLSTLLMAQRYRNDLTESMLIWIAYQSIEVYPRELFDEKIQIAITHHYFRDAEQFVDYLETTIAQYQKIEKTEDAS